MLTPIFRAWTGISKFVEAIRIEPKNVAECPAGDGGAFGVRVPAGESCVMASAQGSAAGFAHFVTAGHDVPETVLALENPYAVNGNIVDGSGKPVEGAGIVIVTRADGKALESGRFVFERLATISGKDEEIKCFIPGRWDAGSPHGVRTRKDGTFKV